MCLHGPYHNWFSTKTSLHWATYTISPITSHLSLLPHSPPAVFLPTSQIAELTITALKRTVPPALPGIFFLSGEMPLDVDNEEDATINLNAMHQLYPTLPWHVSFSYGKALQKTAIITWLGKAENNDATQKALKARAAANKDAVFGKYKAGTCASVGTDGNIQQAAGPY